jgi:hypothetical protein
MTTHAALYNTERHPAVSDKYNVMPTYQIVEKMEQDGWRIAKYDQVKARSSPQFAKHLLRMRRPDHMEYHEEVAPEVLIINSHNRTSTLRFMLGFFRFICSNGLISGEILDNLTFRHHVSNPFDLILDAANEIYSQAEQKVKTIRKMQATELSYDDTHQFLRMASDLIPNRVYANVFQLDVAHQEADQGPSVWNTFNRIQSNLMGGNATIRSTTNRLLKARPVKALDKNLKLNVALWNLAESFLPQPTNDETYVQAA